MKIIKQNRLLSAAAFFFLFNSGWFLAGAFFPETVIVNLMSSCIVIAGIIALFIAALQGISFSLPGQSPEVNQRRIATLWKCGVIFFCAFGGFSSAIFGMGIGADRIWLALTTLNTAMILFVAVLVSASVATLFYGLSLRKSASTS